MDDYRLISKTFRCDNCDKRFRKLVNVSDLKTRCESCGDEGAFAIEESEFNREEADRTYRIAFNHLDENFERQFHPRTDLLDRDPNNIYGDARRVSPRAGGVGASGQRGQREAERTFTTSRPTQVRISPTTSQARASPTTRIPTQTRIPSITGQLFIPYSISPFSGSVRRQPVNFPFGNFFSDFLGIGLPSENFFMDNFASNFSSNFEDPLTRIIFLQSMQNQPSGTPPASKEVLKKLKRFKMNEEFCKKSEKGALEYPSCSVCLTEIAKNEPTLLIPCGHMFHDGCINKWLEMHNTCPVCRYELPTDDQDYEGARQGRSQNGSPNFNRNRENENVNPNIMQNINANASPRRF